MKITAIRLARFGATAAAITVQDDLQKPARTDLLEILTTYSRLAQFDCHRFLRTRLNPEIPNALTRFERAVDYFRSHTVEIRGEEKDKAAVLGFLGLTLKEYKQRGASSIYAPGVFGHGDHRNAMAALIKANGLTINSPRSALIVH